jgi:ribosomal protein S18 acetylase RimI-like enzyme
MSQRKPAVCGTCVCSSGTKGPTPFGEKERTMANIRTAELSDAREVLRLWDSAAGPTRLPSNERAISLLIANDADALLVAEDSGRIVGTLIGGWDGWRCHLYRAAVHPDFRRSGVASQLVSVARGRARSLGVRRLDAMVDDDNVAAQSFWGSLGFAPQGEDRRWSSSV